MAGPRHTFHLDRFTLSGVGELLVTCDAVAPLHYGLPDLSGFSRSSRSRSSEMIRIAQNSSARISSRPM